MKPGEIVYLKRVTVYHQCRVRVLYEYQNAAKVDYYASGGPVICRQDELLTEGQYQAMVKQRRKDAAEKAKAANARERLSGVIVHWEAGRRTAKEMAGKSTAGTKMSQPAYWVNKIEAAKRWGFIS